MSSFGLVIGGFFKEKKQWLGFHWLGLLAVTILGLLPFLSFFFSGEALFASDQLGAPAWKFYFEALRHGTIPMWHPYALGGMPTFDAGFGDGAYPLFLVIGILLPLRIFISYCFVLHVVIAGLTAYYFINRFFNLNRILSVALAMAYMLNTNFISHLHAGHTGKFYIMAWLPLALYFLLRNLQTNAKVRHALGLTLTISLLLLTFHPQFMYFVLMGFFLAWVFKSYLLIKEKKYLPAAKMAYRFWGSIILGIGLVFFIFYPPMQYTKNYGVRGSTEKTTYEHATSWSIHPEETAGLIVPEFSGINERYWGRNPFKLNSEYPGLTVLFLGIFGLVIFRREKGKWFWLWGGIGLLSIIFGLGAHTPLFHLFYSFIPGIKNFRAPSMMLFWLATALLIMSADTLSRLSRVEKPLPEEKRKAIGKKLSQIGFGFAALFILMGILPDLAFSIWDAVFSGEPFQNLANRVNDHSAFALGAIRTGILIGALVFATKKWLLKEVAPVHFGAALILITGADLYWVNSNFISTYNPDPNLSENSAFTLLKSDTSSFRIFGIPGAYERWVSQYHLIETTDGFTDNEYRLYREYRGNDYQQNPNLFQGLKQNSDGTVSGSAFMDMLNVKYLAYRLQNDNEIHLAKNSTALPRAWLVNSWDTLPESQALDKMKDPAFNPKQFAYLSNTSIAPHLSAPLTSTPADSNLAKDSTQNLRQSTSSISLVNKDYNHSEWKVSSSTDAIFVLSELWFPHWKVKVDQNPSELIRTDFAFRGVKIPSGTHTISFYYQSPWIAFGLKIGMLSFVLFIGYLFSLILLNRKFKST